MVAYSGKQTYEFIRPDGVLQRVSSIWLTNINQTQELPIREFKTKYNPELHQKLENKSYYEDNGKFYIQPYTRVLITLNKDFNNIKE